MKEMCCSPGHHGHRGSFGGHAGRHCCCCSGEQGMRFARRFVSREERLARLEEYLKELKAETRAVEEVIADLRK